MLTRKLRLVQQTIPQATTFPIIFDAEVAGGDPCARLYRVEVYDPGRYPDGGICIVTVTRQSDGKAHHVDKGNARRWSDIDRDSWCHPRWCAFEKIEQEYRARYGDGWDD